MKTIYWVGSSLKDLKEFPKKVQREIGYALHFVQIGLKHKDVKHLKGIDSGVMEIVTNFNTDTYRTVYISKINNVVYVLHAFQKKSKHGITTPKQEVETIKKRLKEVKEHLK